MSQEARQPGQGRRSRPIEKMLRRVDVRTPRSGSPQRPVHINPMSLRDDLLGAFDYGCGIGSSIPVLILNVNLFSQ